MVEHKCQKKLSHEKRAIQNYALGQINVWLDFVVILKDKTQTLNDFCDVCNRDYEYVIFVYALTFHNQSINSSETVKQETDRTQEGERNNKIHRDRCFNCRF